MGCAKGCYGWALGGMGDDGLIRLFGCCRELMLTGTICCALQVLSQACCSPSRWFLVLSFDFLFFFPEKCPFPEVVFSYCSPEWETDSWLSWELACHGIFPVMGHGRGFPLPSGDEHKIQNTHVLVVFFFNSWVISRKKMYKPPKKQQIAILPLLSLLLMDSEKLFKSILGSSHQISSTRAVSQERPHGWRKQL